jgi:predicted NAD-dependent protein-ADP-ribosyltransferase YbiA (DUF1768 family)
MRVFRELLSRHRTSGLSYHSPTSPTLVRVMMEPEQDCVKESVAKDIGQIGQKSGEGYFWEGHSTRAYMTNGYESAFVVDKMIFRSVSWYMWYIRAKMWRPNTDLAALIREAQDQNTAKQLSRRCTSASVEQSATWRAQRLKIMAKAVEVMKQLEDTIKRHEETLQALEQSRRNAADESFIPQSTDTLLERTKILEQVAGEPYRNDSIATGRRIVLPPKAHSLTDELPGAEQRLAH